MSEAPQARPPAHFERKFFTGDEDFTIIGDGAVGGKAQGLALARELILRGLPAGVFTGIDVHIPRLTVLTTAVFDRFMQGIDRSDLEADLPDSHLGHSFQKADFPVEFLGDLRALVEEVHQPLAVRSSSLLEDALHHPFAGVYGTKMIPNNELDADTRFRKLLEAIKFVYASTFSRGARAYLRAVGRSPADEKMAVIIQEVVGRRCGGRFYPTVSGVARSYNFYALGHARPEQGVVDLAAGLGKTIVDGGLAWTYCPAQPAAPPPYGSTGELLKYTQKELWVVNMGRPPAYDPIAETEYLMQIGLAEAEADGTLRDVASTYDPASDRLVMGTGSAGLRVLNFAPLLQLPEIPVNALIRRLLSLAEESTGAKVEIEFAMVIAPERDRPVRFGFLQIRPMLVSTDQIDVDEADLLGPQVLVASTAVLGNGALDTLCDVVYVRPESFAAAQTPAIAAELASINAELTALHRSYVLIGFGRWGSSDPWLGTPVEWPQICGAKVIVEATLPDMDVDASQGSHFFHNICSFQVSYFSVHHAGRYRIDWAWLAARAAVEERRLVRWVRLESPLRVRVDGRTGRGVIVRGSG